MNLSENINIKPYHTFGIDINARYFYEVSSEPDLVEILKTFGPEHWPLLVLGAGSNMFFTSDWKGTVLKISTKGIEIKAENDENVFVCVAAGVVWDDFVKYTVNNGWGGLENLSLIPGSVGASPIQNIGAYGVEMSDHFHELEAISLKTLERRIFSKAGCQFGYRESIFKGSLKDQYIILNVTFQLDKMPVVKTDYGTIRKELAIKGVEHPGINEVRETVCRIRNLKLPDPAKLGNAGSFFKNPVVSDWKFEELKVRFPGIIAWPQNHGVKLAAAWLIEQCGWKGKRFGDAGVCETQPLVLVNYGHAKGQEIVDLAEKIMASVNEKFGIHLQIEVNII